jgi:hypothetical protein
MRRKNNKPAPHAHEWVVFSTAHQEGWLMLQCVGCGWHAVVADPSQAEWSQAFYAPSRPYRWHEEGRVRVKRTESDGLFSVMHASRGKKCECYARLGVLEPQAYERVPAEVLRPPEALTAEEQADLEVLAEVVVDGNLCSQLFPLYLRCFQQHTGHEVSGAAYRVARRFEHMGPLHCSAAVVARVLAEYARRGTTRS